MKATPMAARPMTGGKSKRAAAAAEFARRQLDLFDLGGDAVAVLEVADRVVAIAEATESAVQSSPAAAAAVEAAGRENVDFARLMQSAGATEDALVEALEDRGVDIDAVLAGLAAVEDIHPLDEVIQGDDFESFDASALVIDAEGDDEPVAIGDAETLEDQPESDQLAGSADGAEQQADGEDAEGDDEVMKAGDSAGANSTDLYLSALRGKRYDAPTPEREAELGRRAMQGDAAAKTELVERNMRFMVTVARRFLKTGRPFDDLMQAGAEGLMAAADKFDPSKARFTTFSAWWITQRIQRAVRADDNMPTPAYLPYEEAKLKRQAEEATTPEEREHLLARANKAAQRLEMRRKGTVSLNQSTTGDEDDGGELHDILAAEAPGHEERAEQMQLVRKMLDFANRLGDQRSTNIFLMRTGMHPDHMGDPQTLQEISVVFKLTRERVRQVYTEAAIDIADAMMYWAKGEENLPDGFRKGLLNPGR